MERRAPRGVDRREGVPVLQERDDHVPVKVDILSNLVNLSAKERRTTYLQMPLPGIIQPVLCKELECSGCV